ncbi:hypothetical protein Cfla_1880 [Cellulomonas flavigena DSM 20109]|uniref:Uncharacterized protein n=1 Tax=Cellulomonas flavigena (strain ATCC 482 / DSM 20109 / BCRC 11376 / JCM 18109 / NBRC 3775 / NCIMB 8073 / NRS 134) TaxID=446466 RepID=D5UEW7_CELFN|nr:hypothetical protein [Cellulomonas flavigena]ADG74777.1 hypothetical protein Cfla_1880 [Cellulomonas flavigena DSM 20109]
MSEPFVDVPVPELEFDETIPPRPEEEVADVARSAPDRAGHGGEGLGDDVLQADSRGGGAGPTTPHGLS